MLDFLASCGWEQNTHSRDGAKVWAQKQKVVVEWLEVRAILLLKQLSILIALFSFFMFFCYINSNYIHLCAVYLWWCMPPPILFLLRNREIKVFIFTPHTIAHQAIYENKFYIFCVLKLDFFYSPSTFFLQLTTNNLLYNFAPLVCWAGYRMERFLFFWATIWLKKRLLGLAFCLIRIADFWY